MEAGGKIYRWLAWLLMFGLLLPPLLAAEDEIDSMAAFRLANTCEPCNVDADCISNNCGVNVSNPADKRCIPAGAATYNCTDDSSSG
jgi:hypothetical protein